MPEGTKTREQAVVTYVCQRLKSNPKYMKRVSRESRHFLLNYALTYNMMKEANIIVQGILYAGN